MKAFMKNPVQSPATSAVGGLGLATLLSDVDEVHTPTGWVKFGIKAATYFFFLFAKDPWKKE
jgi:hypothetical protein